MSGIQLTKRSYIGSFALLALASAIGTVAAVLLSAQGGQPPAPTEIDGVPREKLEQANIFLTTPEGESSAVSSETAFAVVKEIGLGEPVRAVLAHYRNPGQKPDTERLAWVVVMDPDTVPLPNKDTDYIEYTIHFVDAKTSEWFFAFGEAVSCSQTPETMTECSKRGITPKAPGYPEEAQLTP